MDLKDIVKRLEEYADLKIACDWDNVGLLVEPSEKIRVEKVLVTNDLTEPVLDEAIQKGANMIIAYHPAIFKPFKRLTQNDWNQRMIVKCIEKRIAVYSPHTTWDSVNGGINDWIIQSFEPISTESASAQISNETPCGFSKTVKINVPLGETKEEFVKKVSQIERIKQVSERVINLGELKSVELEFFADANQVASLIELIRSSFDSSILQTLRIYNNDKPLVKNVGLGRIGYLREPIKIRDIVEKMKSLLQMKTFRLALGNHKTLDDEVKVISVGAGCCSDLLNNVNAEFIITGEFLHHEIIHEVQRGVSLIVTDHSKTERGYIQVFKSRFTQLLGKYDEHVEILISEIDRDPLEYI